MKLADTACCDMALGLLAFGNVPTSWSGMPFADSVRLLASQNQSAVLVVLTDAELLKAL